MRDRGATEEVCHPLSFGDGISCPSRLIWRALESSDLLAHEGNDISSISTIADVVASPLFFPERKHEQDKPSLPRITAIGAVERLIQSLREELHQLAIFFLDRRITEFVFSGQRVLRTHSNLTSSRVGPWLYRFAWHGAGAWSQCVTTRRKVSLPQSELIRLTKAFSSSGANLSRPWYG